MPGCVLHLTGAALDPAALDLGALRPYATYRAGDPCGPAGRRRHDRGGLKCLVSDRPGSDLPGQLEDATTFLRQHGSTLAALTARDDVQDAYLDFGVLARLGRVAVQVDVLPAALVRLAGAAGLALMLSTYPSAATPPGPEDLA